MGLESMGRRIFQNGLTVRDEMVKDGRDLLSEELMNDPSYCPTMYIYKYEGGEGKDIKIANVRLYKRGQSSLTGNYQSFLTTVDNPILIGDYLHDTRDDTYWIVNESYYVDDIHYQGKMVQCNYLLRWQMPDDTIVERWANVISAAKYNTGQEGNATFKLTSNNYTVLITYDEYGLELDEQRVFIDRREVKPTKVYKITRDDDILYDSGGMGSLLSFIASKTEYNPSADNQEMRICNYREPNYPSKPNVVSGLAARINGLPQLKLAFPRTYTVSFWDTQLNEVDDCAYAWIVDSDFDIIQELTDDGITLAVYEDEYCGKTFTLSVLVDGEIITETEIMIVEGM